MQYSLNSGGIFQPFELQLQVTPHSIREALRNKEWSTALMYSLQLNESVYIREVIESIPFRNSTSFWFNFLL
jgi:periodic tryptophan protein 2